MSVVESEAQNSNISVANEVESGAKNVKIAEESEEESSKLLVDFVAWQKYTNDPNHIYADLKVSSVDVTTDGSEILKGTEKRIKNTHGIVKIVPKIGRCLLSFGQLKKTMRLRCF